MPRRRGRGSRLVLSTVVVLLAMLLDSTSIGATALFQPTGQPVTIPVVEPLRRRS
jgi:hypothetical protein